MPTVTQKSATLLATLAGILLLSSVSFGYNLPDTRTVYNSIDSSQYEKPPFDLFERGLYGFRKLQNAGSLPNDQLLTLIDFRRSGNEERLWVIDLKNNKILYHILVAHGRNSGELFASKFSNIPNSNQSSLGFYVTGKTYIGKHGVSLILHGAENGINDKAESRSIVMHGADYVSDSFIKRVGRLGRSFGCPAVPVEIHKELIKQLANGTCLFIFYPDPNYIAKTTLGNNAEISASSMGSQQP